MKLINLFILIAVKLVRLHPIDNPGTQPHLDFDHCYREATSHNEAKAQNSLGLCYEDGVGVEKNETAAVEWYTKAANQGFADAQLNLGFCYEDGIGVEKNFTAAVEWFTMAANQGHDDAQFGLGDFYYAGIGVEKNYSTAVEWFTKAANQGYDRAQYNVGNFYFNGIGVDQNYSTAVEWYTKAANQGHADAQFGLGICYLDGIGVEKNYTAAAEWFLEAAKNPSLKIFIAKSLAKENMTDLARTIISQDQIQPDVAFGREDPCHVCYGESDDKVIFSCNHATVCFDCFLNCVKNDMFNCPSCNLEISDVGLMPKTKRSIFQWFPFFQW